MKVIVTECGWGGYDYPGGASALITTDEDEIICEIRVSESLNERNCQEVVVHTRDGEKVTMLVRNQSARSEG